MSEFTPTHQIIKQDSRYFHHPVGALVQHIGADYYKSDEGHIIGADADCVEVLKLAKGDKEAWQEGTYFVSESNRD